MKSDKTINSTNLTLDRFEGEKAVLTSQEAEIIMPKNFMPKSAQEGSSLVLTISTSEAEEKRRTQKAKELLNEILNSK